MNTTPYWKDTATRVSHPALTRDLTVDVLIVGGGITGVSTAHLLASAGVKVALVERHALAGGDTGHTTAHLTYMTDTRLSEMLHTCGEDHTRNAWEAGLQAMHHIRKAAAGLELDVGLVEVPGYLVAAWDSDLDKERTRLFEEAEKAAAWGFDVEFMEKVSPTAMPGICFTKQLKFHPLLYLHGLAAQATQRGAQFFEHTEISEFGNHPHHAMANDHRIDFDHVVIATHMPMQGNRSTAAATLFQTKLAAYSTYALAAKIPAMALEPMIWSDTAEPFNYIRVERGNEHDLIILGGADHKTGQENSTLKHFDALEQTLKRIVTQFEITHRWSGQVIDTVDGMPYIGETCDGNFIATGYSGNGMTFGTVAALMARDHILGGFNPWKDTFDPGRRELAALPTYLKENSDYPYHLLKDRMRSSKEEDGELRPGQGRIIKVNGHHVAHCRDPEGAHHQLSAVCPHMGCIVSWNDGESTWDCPCHGSRFAADGRVIAGPAEECLEPVFAQARTTPHPPAAAPPW
jgi:glycine/D-amino acid oxidase-like deaminating enzyme/nitrite reductase/ring-hydroxylating ferredoxin subunit